MPAGRNVTVLFDADHPGRWSVEATDQMRLEAGMRLDLRYVALQ